MLKKRVPKKGDFSLTVPMEIEPAEDGQKTEEQKKVDEEKELRDFVNSF